MKHARWMIAAGCAAALALAGASAQAAGTILWNVTANFDDGGQLTGHFYIDQYGYFDAWTPGTDGYDLTTSAGGTLGGFEYTPGDSYADESGHHAPVYIQAQPEYFNSLHLTFEKRLYIGSGENKIIGGAGGPSWECAQSWTCFVPSNGPTRYVVDGVARAEGFAGTPEPAAWALMIAGFGLAGGTLRARRRARA